MKTVLTSHAGKIEAVSPNSTLDEYERLSQCKFLVLSGVDFKGKTPPTLTCDLVFSYDPAVLRPKDHEEINKGFSYFQGGTSVNVARGGKRLFLHVKEPLDKEHVLSWGLFETLAAAYSCISSETRMKWDAVSIVTDYRPVICKIQFRENKFKEFMEHLRVSELRFNPTDVSKLTSKPGYAVGDYVHVVLNRGEVGKNATVVEVLDVVKQTYRVLIDDDYLELNTPSQIEVSVEQIMGVINRRDQCLNSLA